MTPFTSAIGRTFFARTLASTEPCSPVFRTTCRTCGRPKPCSRLVMCRRALGEEGVHRGDHHGALADRGRDPLHRTSAGVADGEETRHRRLERPGVRVERPRAAAALFEHVGAGQHEAPLVTQHARVQPVGVRLCADGDEQGVAADDGLLTGAAVLRRRRWSRRPSGVNFPIRRRRRLLGEHRRHRRPRARRSGTSDMLSARFALRTMSETPPRRSAPGEAPPARGVAAADDVHDAAGLRLASTAERRRTRPTRRSRSSPRQVEPPVGDPRRRHHRPGLQRLAGGDAEHGTRPSSIPMPTTSRVCANCAPKHPGLLVRALRQLGAGDPAGEAEIVADERARSGLPADRLALEHHDVEPLRAAYTAAARPPGPAPTMARSTRDRRAAAC